MFVNRTVLAWLTLPLVVALVSGTGCSTVETQSFTATRSGDVESAQIAVDADFSKYDRLQAADMGIFFPAGTTMPSETVQRLQQTFEDAFLAELEEYSVSLEPGPTTMLVQASLIDLRDSTGTAVSSLRRDIREIARPGSLVFLMEMKDSQTGRVLARAADSARAPALGSGEDSETDWQAVDEAAKHWAMLFRQFLDENFGR